jgi:nitrogen fixation NifU-like protein
MKTAKELYQAVILDHGKAPRNEGPLDDATHEATLTNPLCGDRITLRVALTPAGVATARFEARGCMIARASASLLTEAIRGRTVADALALAAAVEALEELPPELEALSGAREFPARRACVTLAWRALVTALSA